MKRQYHKIISIAVCLVMVFAVGLIRSGEVHSKIATNVAPDISKEELKAVVIEDFEKVADWKLESEPRKNVNAKNKKEDPVLALELKYVDGSPSDLKAEQWSPDKKGMEKKLCMGIHFRFRYPGFNSVHVLPPPEVRWDEPTKAVKTYNPKTGQDEQDRAIQLPGRAKAVSVWFHGRGNDYTLECWVKDWKGDVHILKMGSCNFVGWRPMRALVPINIPQEVESYPQTKVLKIVRFVVRSQPDAGLEDVYMFFDQIKVLTDVFEVNFDGQNLHKVFEGGETKEKKEK